MSARKLSVALDEKVARDAARSAKRHGMSLSAWLNRAAERALRAEDGLKAVADWEHDHGALTDDELAAADAVLGRSDPRRTSKRA